MRKVPLANFAPRTTTILHARTSRTCELILPLPLWQSKMHAFGSGLFSPPLTSTSADERRFSTSQFVRTLFKAELPGFWNTDPPTFHAWSATVRQPLWTNNKKKRKFFLFYHFLHIFCFAFDSVRSFLYIYDFSNNWSNIHIKKRIKKTREILNAWFVLNRILRSFYETPISLIGRLVQRNWLIASAVKRNNAIDQFQWTNRRYIKWSLNSLLSVTLIKNKGFISRKVEASYHLI